MIRVCWSPCFRRNFLYQELGTVQDFIQSIQSLVIRGAHVTRLEWRLTRNSIF